MSTKAQTGCEVTSDVNDICIGDEVRLEFSYPPPGNYSVEFDGVNQLIEVPHQAALDFGNTEFSVEFWFNPDNTAGPAIMFSKISATGVGYAIGINAGLLTVTLNDGSGVPVVITGTTPLQTGVWQHCAVTFDRMGDCTLYLDGLIDAIQTIVGVGSIANSDAIGIGGPAVNVGGLANYFAGKIDEARVWSRVIAGTEISANLTLHLNPDNEIGLNGYWDFNEGGVGVGGVARDCGIAMQDGSLLNGTAFSADVKTFTWDFGVTWNTGDVGYVLFKNPEDTTKYVATSGYCKYECSDSLVINVLPCDSGRENFTEASVWVPNAFTPNGDNKNDIFTIQASFITYFEIMIYARNGNLIFHSKNIQNAWDGTHFDAKVSDNTYTYVIIYRNTREEEFKKYGHVTVIR